MGGRLRSPHGVEIPFAFDNVVTDRFAGSDPRRIELAKCVSDAWATFARSGRPACPKLPEWPAYESQNRATMVLDVVSEVVHDPERERRLIWRDLLQHP
jgi:para-nitrobenzyl esterase